MKFDVIIGNPPYQDEVLGDNQQFAPPVYNFFIDESQKIDFANGKHLKADQNNMSSEAPVCIFYNGELCGIGKWDNPNRIKPEKVFIR